MVTGSAALKTHRQRRHDGASPQWPEGAPSRRANESQRWHSGSSGQKLQGKIAQHQQRDGEEHHRPDVFDLDVFQLHLDIVIWISWRATASAGCAFQFVQIGTATASALILAGAVVNGWAVAVGRTVVIVIVIVAIRWAVIIPVERVLALVVPSLRPTGRADVVCVTEIALVVKRVRDCGSCKQ